jgi:hypothetical protein
MSLVQFGEYSLTGNKKTQRLQALRFLMRSVLPPGQKNGRS